LSDYRARALVVVLVAVALAQLNWYSLPALFPLMTAQLKFSVSELGIISAAFVIGFGFVQVPAGVVAAKVGLKPTVLAGALLISVFSLLVAFASNPYEIAVMRLVAGAGMALEYTPGMMLAIGLLRERTKSLGIGVYSAVGDVGGMVGLFGWGLVAALVGWRSSVLVSATMGVAFAVLLFLLLPSEPSDRSFQVKVSDLRQVLLSKGVLVVSLALLGMECGWNAVVYFIVFYLETQLGVGVGISGLVGGLILGGAILGALVMSRAYSRIQGSSLAFFLIGVACASSVVLVSTGSLYGAALGTVVEGVLNGLAFTYALALVRKMVPVARYEALGVAWATEIGIFGSFWSTLLFSFFVVHSGYPVAWSATSLVGVIFMLPLLLLRKAAAPPTPAANPGSEQT